MVGISGRENTLGSPLHSFSFVSETDCLHFSLYNREPDTGVELAYPSSSHVSSSCDCTLTTWCGSVFATHIARCGHTTESFLTDETSLCHAIGKAIPQDIHFLRHGRHLWAGKHTWFSLALFLFCFRDRLSPFFSLQPRAGHRGRVGISLFVTRLELL